VIVRVVEIVDIVDRHRSSFLFIKAYKNQRENISKTKDEQHGAG